MAVGAGPTLKGGIHTDARGPRQEQVPGEPSPRPSREPPGDRDEATCPVAARPPEPCGLTCLLDRNSTI